MAKNALHTIRLEANRIRAKHPKMSYQSALKKAGKEYKHGTISGTKKKKRSGKRKTVGSSEKPKYKCFHEVRRVGGISYTGGKIAIKGTGTTEQMKKDLKLRIGEEIGWLEVAKSSAKTVRETNAINKMIRAKQAELRRLK